MSPAITSTFDGQSSGGYLQGGQWLDAAGAEAAGLPAPEEARKGTMARRILDAHNSGDANNLHIRFDALASHDITYVGIVQTARASGMKSFPLPYVLTNCHNSLCAVGGTINEDDHVFGLSAAQKYGGDFVPAHLAVIHQYVREMLAGCGKMILGSDSHTRHGALGTLGVGEGGPELVKQLLGRTYDLSQPEVVAVWLDGAPKPGVGPQDVAIALIKSVFAGGAVKNKILEFVGPGIAALSVDYRMGIDVMTTETTCLSSIWETDEKVRDWLAIHGREADYKPLAPKNGCYYDGLIRVDLSAIEPMIALPFHPSNAWTIREFLDNAEDLLAAVEKEASELAPRAVFRPDLRGKLRGGDFFVDQGIVAGCSGGTYENIVRVAAILRGQSTGSGEFGLSVYPASQPQYLELARTGIAADLMQAGITMKTAFCGPCFGAGDVPANNAFSIRHTTRNFPNREGSKPSDGQISYVALMDARSIAATALNKGKLTPATELDGPNMPPAEEPTPYTFDQQVYKNRVYHGFGHAHPEQKLSFGPNIADWPAMSALPENLILTVASAIYDSVTTTDELIPSGETSSYRSNPLRLAEFALSRKDPDYVGRAKAVHALEQERLSFIAQGKAFEGSNSAVERLFQELHLEGLEEITGIGSVIFAVKPGDGSAREQAASSQKVLSGWANIAEEYATKRYRSNLVNWGMLPFVLPGGSSFNFKPGDRIFIPGIRGALASGAEKVMGFLHRGSEDAVPLKLLLPGMTDEERAIIIGGCLINFYGEKG